MGIPRYCGKVIAAVEIPAETLPAPADLVCWLTAAFPLNRRGRVNVRLAADALGVSQSTIRRWIRDADVMELAPWAVTMLKRRAILRGRGAILWPDIDEGTRVRSQTRIPYVRTCLEVLTRPRSVPVAWARNGFLTEHRVHLLWYPVAHVYAVAANRTTKSDQRRARAASILDTVGVPNGFAAELVKELTLESVLEHRCIAPRSLVNVGRTETWRQTGAISRLVVEDVPGANRVRAG